MIEDEKSVNACAHDYNPRSVISGDDEDLKNQERFLSLFKRLCHEIRVLQIFFFT